MTAAAKVAIVGAGLVGSATAFALLDGGLVSEICLVDLDRDKAEGHAMDLAHGSSFVRPVKVTAGDMSCCEGADVVVVTAGRNQAPGETRLDLSRDNARTMREVIPQIDACAPPNAVVVIVTNPVDVLTTVAARLSSRPPSLVLGSGTVLDSSRFRYMLSAHCGVDPRNVHAYVIGEHGDTEVAAWSLTNIAGTRLDDFCPACPKGCGRAVRDGIAERVRDSAYHVIEKKGATYWAVALALRRIVETVVRDENSVLTVSTLLTGQYGLDDVSLSLPCIVGRSGVARVLDPPLEEAEIEALLRSADALKEVQEDLRI
ncbi:MAG: L-lactate dehydrogenase [Firmicutes bacterium]|jgi:L-lactate dehydrogenase|nr:L-lactate dehydrogenase [Bacillota bacterium]